MSRLLIKPSIPDAEGRVQCITPQSAGWKYVGFEVYRLAPGQTLARQTGDREVCLVMLSGRAEATAGGKSLGLIGGRESVFDGPPWSLYVPAKSDWSLRATTPVELAVCSSPATGTKPVRLIPPDEVQLSERGKGTNTRMIRDILPDSVPDAETLLVVEVITPGGNWSSYPPHKHDTDNPPQETYLEETYYHRLKRPGFAFQRLYTDDRSLDETVAFRDGDVVLAPRGYHPVAAPIGFDLYYLNTMAGPTREWHFTMSPEHAFLGW
jgi:5-deoxy-glucuronate isomerase